MQKIADPPLVITVDAERNTAVGLGDRGKVEMLPTPLLDQMASKIVRVQALHHHYDRAFGFVVKPRKKGAGEPLFLRLTRAFRVRILWFERVVDNDQVAAATGQCATDRGGQARAAGGGHDFSFGVL